MTFPGIDKEAFDIFYASCRTVAQVFYRDETSQPYPWLRSMKESVSFRRVSGTAFDDFSMDMAPAQRNTLVRNVKNLGFNQIGHLADGGSASVFLVRNTLPETRDRVFALRVPFHQASGAAGPEDERHIRPNHPMFLQPLVSFSQAFNGVAAEILPYVPVLGQGARLIDPALFSFTIRSVCMCAGVELDRFDGVGILPNGTFVFVDPDQGRVTPEDPLADVQRVQRRGDSTVRWVNEAGVSVQREFWPVEKLFPQCAAG